MTNREKTPRQVPWTCFAEWAHVAALLFGQDIHSPHSTASFFEEDGGEQMASDESRPSTENSDNIRKALQIIDVWMRRGRIPKAVEATYNLMQLYVGSADTGNHLLEESLKVAERLALNSAIIRFVNEMVDGEQRGAYATSITKIAEKIGLPRMLVDLRHEGTHEALPSLYMLHVGQRMALGWLCDNYWRVQANWKAILKDSIREGLRADKPRSVLSNVDYLHGSAEVQHLVINVLFEPEFVVKMELMRDAIDALAEWLQPARLMSILAQTSVASTFQRFRDEHIAYARQRTKFSENPQTLLTKRPPLEEEGPVERSKRLIRELKDRHRSSNALPPSPANDKWRVVADWRPCPIGCTPSFNPRSNPVLLYRSTPIS